MDQCTTNYECLVVSNNTQSNKIEDIIYWYKAEIHGDFRIGLPEFWGHSAQHYRDSEEAEVNKYDPNAGVRLKGPQIQVRKGGQ
jgi:hypothetical protein